MRKYMFKFFLTVLVSLLVLAVMPSVQVSPAQAAETNTAKYGADANPTGDPIGGGTGYSNIVTSGDYAVETKAELLAALSAAKSGQVIYVEETANINMGGGTYGTLSLSVPSGVTIASNRGWNGSLGGRIYWSKPSRLPHYKHFFAVGNNVTFNGIRLEGPDGSIGSSGADPLIDGIYSSGKTGLVVENCEIYNWPYAGIAYYSDGLSGLDSATKAYIHHNYIHNCRRQGLGYGVQLGNSSALIEANIFDYGRHFISGERSYPDRTKYANCEARYNIFRANCTNTLVDMHGGNDDASMGFPSGPDAAVAAGGETRIHHNTFESASQPSVGIRGIPAIGCDVSWNWTYWKESSQYAAFNEQLKRLGYSSNAPPYVNMTVHDNWYGSTPPQTTPPVVPAPPPIPAAPTLSSPANGANVSGTSVTFRWNASGGATEYFLTVSTDPNLTVAQNSSSVRKYWGEVGDVTQYTVTAFPDDGTTYYWWVQAGNANGWCSQDQVVANGGWSLVNGTGEETPSVPEAPTLASPANGANVSGTSVTFRWNASPGATEYFLIVSTDPNLTVAQNSSSVRKYWGELGDVTQYTVTRFPDNGTTYYWWVWAGNANGWCSQDQVVANGGWSLVNGTGGWTPSVPAAPTLSSPANGASVSGTSVTFRWNASAGATKYFLIVSTNPSLTVTQNSSSVRKYWGQLGDVTQYTVTRFPDNGTTYYWWVWAGNDNGWCSQDQVVANGGWSLTDGP